MNIIKSIFTYLIWTLLAILLGIVYMRIILGPNNAPDEDIWFLFHVFYNYGLFYLGLIIGGIIAFLFILIDIFYLKRKLKMVQNYQLHFQNMMVVIMLVVGIIHYILEKVIDVI